MSQHAQPTPPSARATSGTSAIEHDRHAFVDMPQSFRNSHSTNGQSTINNADEIKPEPGKGGRYGKLSMNEASASRSRRDISVYHKSLAGDKTVKFSPSSPRLGRTPRDISADHIDAMPEKIKRREGQQNEVFYDNISLLRRSRHNGDEISLDQKTNSSRKHPPSGGFESQNANLDRLKFTVMKDVVPDEHPVAALKIDKPHLLSAENTGTLTESLVGNSDSSSSKSRVQPTSAGCELSVSSKGQSLKRLNHSQKEMVSSPGCDSDKTGKQGKEAYVNERFTNGKQAPRTAIVSTDQTVTGDFLEGSNTSKQLPPSGIQTGNYTTARLENQKNARRASVRRSAVVVAGKTVADAPFHRSGTIEEQPSQSTKRPYEHPDKPAQPMNHHSTKSQSNGSQERTTKALRRGSYKAMGSESRPSCVNSASQAVVNALPKEVIRDDACLEVYGNNAVPSGSFPEDVVHPSETRKKFSCKVEMSTSRAHRIVADIEGQQMVGWVIPVDGKAEESATLNGHRKEPVSKSSFSDGDHEEDAKVRHVQRDDMHSRLTAQTVLSSDVPRSSVIIIGAGIAGIAAARALTDRGFNVMVLESRGRVGGRIATDWTMGSPVELGACFIHGSYGNPLAMIAREADLRTYSPTDVQNLMFANGEPVSPSADREAEEIWRALTRRAERIAETALAKREVDISLGSILRKLRRMLREPCSKETEFLLSWHASNLELACAADLDKLSARHYDMDVQFGFSGPHEIVRDGYGSIVKALATNLDIRLNSVVTAVHGDVTIHHVGKEGIPNGDARRSHEGGKGNMGIPHVEEERGPLRQIRYLDKVNNGKDNNSQPRWLGWDAVEKTSQKSGVRVMTEDGMAYLAEYCLVTVPLGVLKNGDIKFSPALPTWKRDAIESIGFGVVNKVALRFDRAFWVDDQRNRNGEAIDEDGPDHIGRVPTKHGVFTMFLSMVRCTGAPILVAITAGKFAKYIEKQTDSEVVQMAMEALKQTYGAARMGHLIAHRVTRWGLDRFSRGSYSYAKVGSSPQDYAKMCEPVGKVFFAGEATHRSHPATAHGAFMSGIREASRIIERSDLNSADRRRMAMDLYMMQEPHRMGTISPGQRDMKRGASVTGSSRFQSNGNIRRNGRGR